MITDPKEAAALWTYARFEPGYVFGTIKVYTGPDRRASWESIYGGTHNPILPEGVLVAAMMEAYIKAIQPRPDGNVHAAQKLSFSGQTAEWGDVLQMTVSCAGKELKNDRRWVDFAVEGRGRGNILLQGQIRSIWAA